MPLCAQVANVTGKVVMKDGSTPPKSVLVERVCGNGRTTLEGRTNRNGEYRLREALMAAVGGWSEQSFGGIGLLKCYLRGSLSGYVSTLVLVDELKLGSGGKLEPIVLSRKGEGGGAVGGPEPPKSARKPWDAALKEIDASRFDAAERLLRSVVHSAPQFSPAWQAIAMVCLKQKKYDDARTALKRTMELVPNDLTPRLLLVRLTSETKDWPTVMREAQALIERDSAHRYPEAYLHLAVAQANLGQLESAERNAGEALRLDVKQELANAGVIRMQIAEARRRPTTTLPELAAVEINVNTTGRAMVPGGPAALARMAQMKQVPPAESFFAEYARTVVRRLSPASGEAVAGYGDAMRAYFSALPELAALGEARGDASVVALSLSGASERAHAERALGLLGWRVVDVDGVARVRRSEEPASLARHAIATALGIDCVAMIAVLESGRRFEFEIGSGDAPLMGGDAWLSATAARQTLSGGVAEAFVRDPRLARGYAGLSAAGPAAAAAIVSEAGLNRLLAEHAETLYLHASALRLRDGAVVLPGGAAAATAWSALAGKAPAQPGAFFRAVIEKDHGKLASFYAALAKLDDARVRRLLEHGAALYAAHNDADADLYARCPVEVITDPAKRRAWADVDALEQKRGTAFDAASADLLRRRHADWRPLWPYLERIPADLNALESFTQALEKAPPERREPLAGAWYGLAELIAIQLERSALTPAQAASAFNAACNALAAGRLPQLDGPLHRRLPADLSAAVPLLTEAVYAERLDPRLLLRAEDAGLAARHRFLSGKTLFSTTAFERSNLPSGSRFTGGLMSLAGAARPLARIAIAGATGPVPAQARTANRGAAPVEPAGVLFRSDVRLVEVPATVFDAKGRYVDDLRAADFTVTENGRPLHVAGFEAQSATLTCALVLDTTESMRVALPALQNSALELVGKMRSDDAVGVYTFSETLVTAAPFSSDKDAARRAVVAAEALGETALNDALIGVIDDMAGRQGKKVIVVFTDGDDTASTLSMEAAVRRARAAGIPLYTVAQGMALASHKLLAELETISKSTGGLSFAVRDARQISDVFDQIAKDLSHGYLITVQPAAGASATWHAIAVEARRSKGLRVRARQSYYVP